MFSLKEKCLGMRKSRRVGLRVCFISKKEKAKE